MEGGPPSPNGPPTNSGDDNHDDNHDDNQPRPTKPFPLDPDVLAMLAEVLFLTLAAYATFNNTCRAFHVVHAGYCCQRDCQRAGGRKCGITALERCAHGQPRCPDCVARGGAHRCAECGTLLCPECLMGRVYVVEHDGIGEVRIPSTAVLCQIEGCNRRLCKGCAARCEGRGAGQRPFRYADGDRLQPGHYVCHEHMETCEAEGCTARECASCQERCELCRARLCSGRIGEGFTEFTCPGRALWCDGCDARVCAGHLAPGGTGATCDTEGCPGEYCDDRECRDGQDDYDGEGPHGCQMCLMRCDLCDRRATDVMFCGGHATCPVVRCPGCMEACSECGNRVCDLRCTVQCGGCTRWVCVNCHTWRFRECEHCSKRICELCQVAHAAACAASAGAPAEDEGVDGEVDGEEDE